MCIYVISIGSFESDFFLLGIFFGNILFLFGRMLINDFYGKKTKNDHVGMEARKALITMV